MSYYYASVLNSQREVKYMIFYFFLIIFPQLIEKHRKAVLKICKLSIEGIYWSLSPGSLIHILPSLVMTNVFSFTSF